MFKIAIFYLSFFLFLNTFIQAKEGGDFSATSLNGWQIRRDGKKDDHFLLQKKGIPTYKVKLENAEAFIFTVRTYGPFEVVVYLKSTAGTFDMQSYYYGVVYNHQTKKYVGEYLFLMSSESEGGEIPTQPEWKFENNELHIKESPQNKAEIVLKGH